MQATLEEVCEADLLLHVLDASSPNVHHQRASVLQVRHTCHAAVLPSQKYHHTHHLAIS